VAAQMILSGEPISTDDALRWRLVHAVVGQSEMDEAIAKALSDARRNESAIRRRRAMRDAAIN
jgi:enoyl-CoA hydratase/carnithine racemase